MVKKNGIRTERENIELRCLIYSGHVGLYHDIMSHCHLDDLEGWSVGPNSDFINRKDGLTMNEAIDLFMLKEGE